MKVATKRIGHEGTVGDADRTLMSFDENSIAHIMSVLTDMYSNPTLAVIREYSVNAVDSHAAAKTMRPIEVTLPDRFDPNFKVRDYGVGLDRDGIVALYSKYGASSKRDTNSEAGMLGIGCKSALTYTSQFIVTAIKDGMSHTVLVTRDESGVGAVQFISSEATTEPTGVEVSVPVKEVNSFVAEARNFFSYWEPQLVLINGQHPVPFHENDSVRKLLDNFFIVPGQNTHKVVMGNIPYPLDPKQIKIDTLGIANTFSAVFVVPIGSVDFAPSREALFYSKRTLATLQDVFDKAKAKSESDIQVEIDKAQTAGEAADLAFSWSKIFPKMKFRWKGKDFPITYSVQSTDNVRKWQITQYDKNPQSYALSGYNTLSFQEVHKAFNVLSFKGNSVTASMKDAVRDTMTKAGVDMATGTKTIYFWQDCPWADYLHPDRTIDLANFKVKTSSATKKKPAPKDRLPNYMYWLTGDKLSTRVAYPESADTVIWLYRGDHHHGDFSACAATLDLEKTPIIMISRNQGEKFKRCHPDAVEFNTYFKQVGDKIWDGVSTADKNLSLRAEPWMRELAQQYKPGLVLDPELDELLKVLAKLEPVRLRWECAPTTLKYGSPYMYHSYNSANNKVPVPAIVTKLSERYPLASHVTILNKTQRVTENGWWTLKVTQRDTHFFNTVVEYINAVRMYRENEKKVACPTTTTS